MALHATGRSRVHVLSFIGVVVFLLFLVGFIYNHLDTWPTKGVIPAHSYTDHSHHDDHAADDVEEEDKEEDKDEEESKFSLIGTELSPEDYFLKTMWKPAVDVAADIYKPYNGIHYKVEGERPWNTSLGKKLCIIDLDTRPFDEPGQIFGPQPMSWERKEEVAGTSLGILNHWLYARIHGYQYYYVVTNDIENRRGSWMKPPVMSKLLKDHDACIFFDSDAMLAHLEVPFEWLMNFWSVRPGKDMLTLSFDPDKPYNKDKFGEIYLNTGFIIAQNTTKTHQILREWWECPNNSTDALHPECVEFLHQPVDHWAPTDQGAFGTFTRYDHPDDIKALDCQHANGFPETGNECRGTFVSHVWSSKQGWLNEYVGRQVPGEWLEIMHRQFLAERNDFFRHQDDLLGEEEAEWWQ